MIMEKLPVTATVVGSFQIVKYMGVRAFHIKVWEWEL